MAKGPWVRDERPYISGCISAPGGVARIGPEQISMQRNYPAAGPCQWRPFPV